LVLMRLATSLATAVLCWLSRIATGSAEAPAMAEFVGAFTLYVPPAIPPPDPGQLLRHGRSLPHHPRLRSVSQIAQVDLWSLPVPSIRNPSSRAWAYARPQYPAFARASVASASPSPAGSPPDDARNMAARSPE